MTKPFSFIPLLLSLHLTSHAMYGVQTITFVNTSLHYQWLSVYTPAVVNQGEVLNWLHNRVVVPPRSLHDPSYVSLPFLNAYEYGYPSSLKIVNHLWFTDEKTSFTYDTYPSYITCHIAPNNMIACSA